MRTRLKFTIAVRRGGSRTFRAFTLSMAAACAIGAVAAPTQAATGAPKPAASAAESGGSLVVIVPKITKIECRRSCARRRGIRAGSVIRISGKSFGAVGKVVFLGSHGKTDDVSADVAKRGDRRLILRVPIDATTGPIALVGANGARSKPSAPLAILPRPPVIAAPDLTLVSGFQGPPGVTLETGTSTPRVVFLGSRQLVRFSLRVNGADATAAITLIRQSTGEPVASWTTAAPAGQTVSVDWDGLSGALPAGPGRYAFRATLEFATTPPSLAAATPLKVTAAVPADDARDAFDLYGHMFPVRGKHDFGQFAAKFGGGRGHQGQDIMAACRTRLVAARGGVVIHSRSHARAGNFIVIRPDHGAGDQAYMHLVSPSPFKPGDRVYTGQAIGNVGRTGRASACHLHFEQWTGEIWRSTPVDPLPDLMAWDLVS